MVTSSSTAGTTSTVQSNTSKKNARNSIVSKSQTTNGLDRDTSNSTRNRSIDDANSSTENTGERTSDDEEAESEAEDDFSDMTPSESDNDRDSDLDFSVNDCHSRRAKKISKRKIRAKKLAAKKRRRSTVEFSDDALTPNRKKTTKLPKKSLNTSSKSSTANQTPTSTVSTTTKSTSAAAAATPVVASVSGAVKSSPAISTIAKSSVNTPTMKSIITSTPRITKVTYLKPSTQNPTKLVSIPKTANSTISSATATLSTSTTTITTSTPTITKATATASNPQTTTTSTPEHKTRIILMKQKDRKPQSQHNSLTSGKSSLFTPDLVRKHPNTTGVSGNTKNSISSIHSAADTKVIQSVTSRTLTPITLHAVTTTQSSAQRTNLTKLVKTHSVVTYQKKTPKSTVNLASEQDKQLDLIDSLVEELSRSETGAVALSQSKNASESVVPAAIPNIVKMLQTSDAHTPMQTTEMSTQQATSTSNSMSYTTTSSVTDSQMLPDDLLQSFVNNDEFMDDELMQIAKLVDDKNVQDIIDQSIGSMSSCPASIPPAPPIQTIATEHNKSIEPPQTTSTCVKMEINEPKTPGIVAKSAPNTPVTAGKEGIKYAKRSDGSFIPLPPIEAPTTRGAKRRAETTPGSDVQQPKQKVFTVIVQTESSNSPKNAIGSPTMTAATATATVTAQNIKTPSSTPKAKPIGSRTERRASVAIKRSSIESKPRRSMSISNPPPVDGDDDDDDEEDGSDGSYNSEDDPHR